MSSAETSDPDDQRLDKWLWAARFFKTRGLAVEAIKGGHVRVNDQPVKPAYPIRIGERIDLVRASERWTVIVRAHSTMRRPAAEAQALYEETPDSVSRRETVREMQRLAPTPGADLRGRPTKKDRRRLRAANPYAG